MRAERVNRVKRRRPAGERGAVMAETVLVLPLIVLVLSLIFFFGWAMRRLEQTSVLDRYEAWRQVEHAPGPAPTEDSTSELNQTFFADHAQRIELASQIAYPDGARRALINDAYGIAPSVGKLAAGAIDQWPEAREVVVETTQNSEVALWQLFAGPLRHHHVRLDNEWKYVNRLHLSPRDEKWHPVARPVLGVSPNLRRLFFPVLDRDLESLAQRGDLIAKSMHDAYALEVGYAGPSLPAGWHVEH